MQNGQVTYTENGVLLPLELFNKFLTKASEQEAEILYLKQEFAQLKRMIFGTVRSQNRELEEFLRIFSKFAAKRSDN